jgi:inositol polyphosphate 1-phosphatase
VIYAAGAGYKLLCLALSLSDTYISSQPSTYRWDTCALHAILKSMGGGILRFSDTIALKSKIFRELESYQLSYLENINSSNGIKMWCNLNGIIAYRSLDCLKSTINDLLNDS